MDEVLDAGLVLPGQSGWMAEKQTICTAEVGWTRHVPAEEKQHIGLAILESKSTASPEQVLLGMKAAENRAYEDLGRQFQLWWTRSHIFIHQRPQHAHHSLHVLTDFSNASLYTVREKSPVPTSISEANCFWDQIAVPFWNL